MVTRTDQVKAEINAALERRRVEIDGSDDLGSLSLQIIFGGRSGHPLRLIYRTEVQEDLVKGR